MVALTELHNRGVIDVCIAACDGLKGLPEAIAEVWLTGQRAGLRRATWCGPPCATRPRGGAITKGLRTVYTAPTAEPAEAQFAEFTDEWASATR